MTDQDVINTRSFKMSGITVDLATACQTPTEPASTTERVQVPAPALFRRSRSAS
jgi:hypothetical protein